MVQMVIVNHCFFHGRMLDLLQPGLPSSTGDRRSLDAEVSSEVNESIFIVSLSIFNHRLDLYRLIKLISVFFLGIPLYYGK